MKSMEKPLITVTGKKKKAKIEFNFTWNWFLWNSFYIKFTKKNGWKTLTLDEEKVNTVVHKTLPETYSTIYKIHQMAEIVDFPHFCLKHIQKEAKLNQTQKFICLYKNYKLYTSIKLKKL